MAWTDYRSGTSYDLYGARVSTGGAVQEPAGIPIAAGPGWVDWGAYDIAYNGPNFVVVFGDGDAVSRARVTAASGAVLDTAGLSGNGGYAIAFDGEAFVVLYTRISAASFGYNVLMTRLSPDGVDRDPFDWFFWVAEA